MEWQLQIPHYDAIYNANYNDTINSGDRIRIQYQPEGGDIETWLDETVPSGKQWKLNMQIDAHQSEEE